MRFRVEKISDNSEAYVSDSDPIFFLRNINGVVKHSDYDDEALEIAVEEHAINESDKSQYRVVWIKNQ